MRSSELTPQWVCLMYHDVLPQTLSRGGARERFAVPLASFERTLDLIAAEGYRGCSVADARRLRGQKRVALSFDDGTISHVEHAFPALVARGFTATFYVTTNWVGQPGFVSWADLREMVAHGMSVQSHTHSHPLLSELNADALRWELGESKRLLDRELAQNTAEISLPGGDFPVVGLRNLIKETGYRVVGSSRWGVNSDSVDAQPAGEIRRCTVRGNVPDDAMRRIIAGDRWLTVRRRAPEAARALLRGTLGANRYARWRRTFLDAVNPA